MTRRAYLLDVSRIQARNQAGQYVLDWDKVAAAEPPIAGVVCKATSGIGFDVDDSFFENVRRARAAGLLVGAYHWWVAGRDPDVQAADFAKACEKVGGVAFHALDFESPPPGEWAERGIVSGTLAPRVLLMAEATERLVGRRPLVYSYGDFLTHLPRSGPAGEALGELARRFELWAAAGPHYLREHSLPREDDDTPDVPGDAEEPPMRAFVPWTGWTLWQFGGGGISGGKYVGNFRCPGIAGYVDANLFNGTAEDFRRWALGAAWAPPAETTPEVPYAKHVEGLFDDDD